MSKPRRARARPEIYEQGLERKLPQMMPPLSGGPRPETPTERNARREALLRHSDFIADYIMERLDYPSKVEVRPCRRARQYEVFGR